MPKQRILHLPGHRHFVTFSTYKRRRFLAPDRTRDIVVEVLQKKLIEHQIFCVGFVVMPNHVHAILFGNESFNVSQFVQIWKKTSSYRIKRFYERELTHYQDACPNEGPIWQPGFYDFNLESEKMINEKLQYMHNNPVQDGLSPTPISWNWSSARNYELGKQVGVTLTP
jgi:putative transposase